MALLLFIARLPDPDAVIATPLRHSGHTLNVLSGLRILRWKTTGAN